MGENFFKTNKFIMKKGCFCARLFHKRNIYRLTAFFLLVSGLQTQNLFSVQQKTSVNNPIYLPVLRKSSPFVVTTLSPLDFIDSVNYSIVGEFINISNSPKGNIQIQTKVYLGLTNELIAQGTQTISNIDILPGQIYPFSYPMLVNLGTSTYLDRPFRREIEFTAWTEITNTRSITVNADVFVCDTCYNLATGTVTNQYPFSVKDIYLLIWSPSLPGTIPYSSSIYNLLTPELKPGQTITFSKTILGTDLRKAKVLAQGIY